MQTSTFGWWYMPAYIWRQMRVRSRFELRAVKGRGALGVGPHHLPDLVRRAPERAEALCALAKLAFFPRNVHGHDFLVAPARLARAWAPWHRVDDQLHCLKAPAARLVV